jgi:hypothetical protein
MTRKDYVAIAAVFQRRMNAWAPHQYETIAGPCVRIELEEVAATIADLLAADNPRFDRARFLKACGVQS